MTIDIIRHTLEQKASHLLIPHGEERLATKLERDDVNTRIAAPLRARLESLRSPVKPEAAKEREAGDQVNRFLLCVLVGKSSRHIKASAKKAGQSLPMTTITRGVLRSYRRAATQKCSPFSGREIDIPALRRLNVEVLNTETARCSPDKLKAGAAKLAKQNIPETAKRSSDGAAASRAELGFRRFALAVPSSFSGDFNGEEI